MFRRLAMLIAAATLAGLLTAAPASAAVNLIQNGGFEEPSLSSNFETIQPASAQMPGWRVESGSVRHAVGVLFPYVFATILDGVQFVAFPSPGTLAQRVNTVVGQTYSVSFAYANLPGETSSSVLFSIFSGSQLASTVLTHSSSTFSNPDWTFYTTQFVANSDRTELRYSGSGHILLDAVSLTAVSAAIPEPATWAMMLIGFAGLGIAARRRERAAPRAP